MRIHEMLDYAYHHGVRALFLENPGVLGRLRLMWVRGGDRGRENYNHKVTIFRSTIIEKIASKAPLYSIKVSYVNPKGNNKLNKTRRNNEKAWTRQAHNISTSNSPKRTQASTKMSNTNNQENRNCPQPWVSVFKD